MNILDEIVSKKRTRVSEAKSIVSIEDIQNQLAKSSSLKSNFKKNQLSDVSVVDEDATNIQANSFNLDLHQMRQEGCHYPLRVSALAAGPVGRMVKLGLKAPSMLLLRPLKRCLGPCSGCGAPVCAKQILT